MNCSKCQSSANVKNGFTAGRQCYKCKNCGCSFSVTRRSMDYPQSFKKKALHLYIEGLGFRSIGRFLGVSNVTVLKWIRVFGEEAKNLQSDSQDIEFVELDEMHSFVGNKKTTAGYGLLLIDMAKDSSTSLLAIEATRRQESFGVKSSIIK